MTDERPGHLDLCSGIGGFAQAAEAAGFQTVAFCEIDPRCRRFLERTWGLTVHPDMRQLDGRQYRGIALLTGGIPCQPASRAGQQRGAEDDRWLWPEALRLLAEVRPAWFVFENPPGIYDVGIDGILSEMERLGYAVRPFEIPACSVGSPQRRYRVWIVGRRVADRPGARRAGETREREQLVQPSLFGPRSGDGDGGGMADAHSGQQLREEEAAAEPDSNGADRRLHLGGAADKLADPAEPRRQRSGTAGDGPGRTARRKGKDAASDRPERMGSPDSDRRDQAGSGDDRRQAGARSAPGPQPDRPDPGNVADAESGRFGANGPAPRSQRHPDKRSKGDVADAEGEPVGTGLREGGARSLRPVIADDPWSQFVWMLGADGKLRRAPDESLDVVNGLHRSILAALGNSIVPHQALPILTAIYRELISSR